MQQQAPQWRVIERWLAALSQIPDVDVVWLEGSLVNNRTPVPGTDIDIRLGIADAAYARLWTADKSQILAGLGHALRLIDDDWVRAITTEGVVVEVAVHKTSALDGLALHEWEVLLNHLPHGQPNFTKLPQRRPAEVWAEQHDCTPEFVWRQTATAMTVLASCPAAFYNAELDSVKFTLDDSRITLIKLMYRYVGVYFAKRYKHFSHILTPECLQDLRYTYVQPGEGPLASSALARATLHTYEMIAKYLQRLSERYGGGFEAEWFWWLHSQVRGHLTEIMSGDHNTTSSCG